MTADEKTPAPQIEQEEPDAEQSQQLEAEEEDQEQSEMVALPGLVAIDLNAADELAARRGAELIVLAGEYEVGKTTLLVSLYELFRQGPSRGSAFVESQTLMALEQRAWGGRAASGGSEPDTERSPSEVVFMHLRVLHDAQKRDLLLSDFWGEFFEHIVEGSPALSELPILHRADTVVVLVNGELIADEAGRHEVLMRAQQLIGGLTEKDVLLETARLFVVLNKIDMMREKDLQWWQSKVPQLRSIASRSGFEPRFMEVAARTKKPPHESQNIPDLLEALLEARAPEAARLPVLTRHPDRSFWSQDS